jgi:hypothetical protein
MRGHGPRSLWRTRSTRSARWGRRTPRVFLPIRTAGVCAFSVTSHITQRDVGTECGRSGQPRPPTCRRAEPQPAGPAMTFPGAWPPDGGPGRQMIQGRPPRPPASSCPAPGPDPDAAKDAGGTGASRPGPRLPRRDPRSASPPRAMAGAACTIDGVPAPLRSRKILVPHDHLHINQIRMSATPVMPAMRAAAQITPLCTPAASRAPPNPGAADGYSRGRPGQRPHHVIER